MIYALVGDSGSGKSTLEKELCHTYGYNKIISYTTRNPRPGEENGKDYYFINNDTFDEMLKSDVFAESEEYSQGRKYGTTRADYVNTDNKVVVLTPNGLRQLKRNNVLNDQICTIYVKANLGTRMKRYIDRCGVDKFNFDDKNEISARVERDYGMFLGIEDEVDIVIDNSEGKDIKDVICDILNW